MNFIGELTWCSVLSQFDTQGQIATAVVNQIFREMQAFVIVCDIENLQSIRDVPQWLSTIEQKEGLADGRQAMVLVNKIETLYSPEMSSMMDNDATRIGMQEDALEEMKAKVARDFPSVTVVEISVAVNTGVNEAMASLARDLASCK